MSAHQDKIEIEWLLPGKAELESIAGRTAMQWGPDEVWLRSGWTGATFRAVLYKHGEVPYHIGVSAAWVADEIRRSECGMSVGEAVRSLIIRRVKENEEHLRWSGGRR